jgi:hypothetical protein
MATALPCTIQIVSTREEDLLCLSGCSHAVTLEHNATAAALWSISGCTSLRPVHAASNPVSVPGRKVHTEYDLQRNARLKQRYTSHTASTKADVRCRHSHSWVCVSASAGSLLRHQVDVRFQILTAVSTKTTAFWDITRLQKGLVFGWR